jgi:hypothetical protein
VHSYLDDGEERCHRRLVEVGRFPSEELDDGAAHTPEENRYEGIEKKVNRAKKVNREDKILRAISGV